MSMLQTRQLGIEFERRVLEMMPSKEYIEKLDTETIYSFLNQQQDKYINDIYKNLDNIPSGTNISNNIEKILQPMISTVKLLQQDVQWISLTDLGMCVTYKLPTFFGLYIRSNSKVNSVYKRKNNSLDESIHIIPNKMLSLNEIDKYIQTPFDSFRILRNPLIVLNNSILDFNWQFGEELPARFYIEIPSEDQQAEAQRYKSITVVHDRFTNIEELTLVYYRRPQWFSILTSTPCELPMDAFDDLVTGAVLLYLQYVWAVENEKKKYNNQLHDDLVNAIKSKEQ